MFTIKDNLNAKTLPEALQYLKNNDCVIVAGGSDILVELRDKHKENLSLLSIGGIDELKGIKLVDGDIQIGSTTTFTEIIENKLVKENLPYLSECLKTIAAPQTRNVGTIGGNICNGMTSADSAPILLCLNAELVLEGETTRTINIYDFYLGFKKVDLNKEILTKIIIKKKNYLNYFGGYHKYALRNALDIAIQGVSVLVKVDNNVLTDVKIAYGVAYAYPKRCLETEKQLIGKEITDELVESIKELVLKELKPIDHFSGSKEFKMHLASELGYRMLTEAINKAI